MGYPIILNGDHAEFEAEHTNTKPEDRPDWPLPSFDARDWAKAFCRRFMILHREGYDTRPVDDDEGLMISWFANTLMRGFDENASRQPALDVRCERGCTLKKVNSALAWQTSPQRGPRPSHEGGK